MTGFIGAMDIEVDGLKAMLEDRVDEQAGSIVFSRGRICGIDAVVAMCGVGLVNAAACASAMIMKYAPDEIIDMGVAGGLLAKSGMRTGDIVIADGTVQHDMDVTALGYDPGLVPGAKSAIIPCDKGVSDRLAACAEKSGTARVFRGVIASGNGFVSSAERSRFIAETFGAAAVEMEGAAVGAVCAAFGVPCTVMRTISDCADGDAPASYGEFCEAAAKAAIEIAGIYMGEKHI